MQTMHTVNININLHTLPVKSFGSVRF